MQNDFVRQVKDRLGTAVVFFELDDLGIGKQVRELEDIAHGGTPKTIDRLGIVTDGHNVVVRMRQQTHDFGLEPVRILILIDHDVAIGMGEAFGDLRVGA